MLFFLCYTSTSLICISICSQWYRYIKYLSFPPNIKMYPFLSISTAKLFTLSCSSFLYASTQPPKNLMQSYLCIASILSIKRKESTYEDILKKSSPLVSGQLLNIIFGKIWSSSLSWKLLNVTDKEESSAPLSIFISPSNIFLKQIKNEWLQSTQLGLSYF